jgi:osmotically-inducible protein OsmY
MSTRYSDRDSDRERTNYRGREGSGSGSSGQTSMGRYRYDDDEDDYQSRPKFNREGREYGDSTSRQGRGYESNRERYRGSRDAQERYATGLGYGGSSYRDDYDDDANRYGGSPTGLGYGGSSYGRDYGDEENPQGSRRDRDETRSSSRNSGEYSQRYNSPSGYSSGQRYNEGNESRLEQYGGGPGRGDYGRGSYGGSEYTNRGSEYNRGSSNQRGGGYSGGGYGGAYGRSQYGRGQEGSGYGEERGWWDRTSDEVASWFGDEDAERRRRMDRELDQRRGRGPKNYRRSDERIKEDVNDRLGEDYYLDASEVEVVVENTEVVLNGIVKSRNEKRRAEDIAERVSGVTNVENRLRVQQGAYNQSSYAESKANQTSYGQGTTGRAQTGGTSTSTDEGASETSRAGTTSPTGSTASTGAAGATGASGSTERTASTGSTGDSSSASSGSSSRGKSAGS